MRLRVGYELVYECPQPTPMLLMLNTHYSRAQDMVVPDHIYTDPLVPLSQYRDSFGNLCTRLTAPAGMLTLVSARRLRRACRITSCPRRTATST